MHVQNLRNSIQYILSSMDEGMSGVAYATDQLLSIFLVETWTHKQGEMLSIDELTDTEYRVLHTWALNARPSYDTRIACVKDMREVFPGLGLSACSKLVP